MDTSRMEIFVKMTGAIDKTTNTDKYCFFCNQRIKDLYLNNIEIYNGVPIIVNKYCPEGMIYFVKEPPWWEKYGYE